MPNLSGFPAIDVAVGLGFLFFLLSTACSAINEAISNVLGWRAKTLEDGLRSMLGDPKVKSGLRAWFGFVKPGGRDVKDTTVAGRIKGGSDIQDDLAGHVLDQWRIRALVRDPDSSVRRRRRPSYLPPRALSLAVAEQIAHGPTVDPAKSESDADKGGSSTPWKETDYEIFTALAERVNKLPDGGQRMLLKRAVADAQGSLEEFRKHIEGAFDDAMQRASGWYKRKVQLMLLVLAVALTVGLNVDSVRVGTRLWQDQAVRSAVTAKATAAANADRSKSPQDAADSLRKVNELNLPLGWREGNKPALADVPRHIPGWLITIAALSLGAPFWFDALSRLARLRGSGVPEKPRSLSDTAGSVAASGTG